MRLDAEGLSGTVVGGGRPRAARWCFNKLQDATLVAAHGSDDGKKCRNAAAVAVGAVEAFEEGRMTRWKC